MEFVVSVIFLLLYNIRPQDWFPGLAGTQVIKPIIAIWLIALFAARSRPSPLPGLLKTPHDWAMLAYLGYIVFFGDAAVMSVLPLLAFYALTVQSVNTWPRLLLYLKFWTWSLVVVAAFGALVPFGIDITGAKGIWFTEIGRLALGTWLHNNPNALCHSIMPALAALYLLYFHKAPVLSKFFLFPGLAMIIAFCAWQTQSKGGYLVGAGVFFLAFVLGKPRWLQAILVVAALSAGVGALSFLPRMSEMGNLSADHGVLGRVLAWEQARMTEKMNPTGVGWQKFVAEFPWKEGVHLLQVQKATHSSYVQVGADLGRYGLFFYLAAMWCALHTLIFFKSTDVDQERCRRILIVFVAAYLVSGWLINRQYHTEYFLLVAAAAALHRLKKGEELAAAEAEAKAREGSEGGDPRRRRQEMPMPARLRRAWEARPAPPWKREDDPAFRPGAAQIASKPFWNRFGLVDLGACIAMTWLTFRLWDKFMTMV
jgi:hypothetical protein